MLRHLLLCGALGVLTGCATDSAPTREVVAGDTLYSIAWESGRDYRELAAWNKIPPPYTIHPGQRLSLVPPSKAVEAPPEKSPAEPEPSASAPPPAKIHVVRRGETLYRIARQHGVKPAELAAWNRIPKPYRIHPGQKLALAAPAGQATATTSQKPARPANRNAPATARATPARPEPVVRDPAPASTANWLWPTRGQILERFSTGSGSKGIDIGGQRGQAIVASAPGNVVYQGSGLRGYGQLIIIKHDEEFLSAYAHNQRIFVKEGESVKRGQKIAEMGTTGTDRAKLHFEIRYRGKPVDPMKYLPGKP
jgi:lipoprotein NlpD